jgi:hypothetical protein
MKTWGTSLATLLALTLASATTRTRWASASTLRDGQAFELTSAAVLK